MPIFYNLLQKIEAERLLPNSFYEARFTLTPNSDKKTARNLKYLS